MTGGELAAFLPAQAWALGLAALVLALMLRGIALRRRLGGARAGLDQLRIEQAAARERLAAQATRLAELAEERDGLSDALHQSRQHAGAVERALDAARLSAARDADLAARETAVLQNLRDDMAAQFRQLADDSLRRQGADLERAHADRLGALLTPFRDQVARFQDEMQAGQRAGAAAEAALREQIAGLARRSEEIGRDAVALTRALKGDKQRQGAWGEMILARVLETAGLVAGQHFRTQSAARDADGRLWRPDVVVDMPGGRSLVIDAKCSLNAYADASAAEDDDTRAAALRRHVAAVRAHVTELSGRGYQALDAGTVDYVLMFLPVEAAFAEALRADPALTAFALERRVGLATPSTLLLALRTVEHLWTVERRDRNAAEIAARAGAIYDKLAGVVAALDEAGAALDAAARAHATAMGRLSRGPGNVIRQAEMLRELGARTTRQIALAHDDAPADVPADATAAE
ncbi:DNA recombination protein RmuC [Paracoccus luteus]|uniref:DNA recombination protein RmuC n=1 Tax=Paracoccus luteus TaxID=2508543 RepID=UPI0010700321|nr:DNA recombination protein RmuC [Paracoccus luteus]